MTHPSFTRQGPESVLLLTLDSCRYDTFASAATPHLDRVGELIRAQAPGNFTFGSHAAMFVGFTPGDPARKVSYANPKFGKILRMKQGGIAGKGKDFIVLEGRNIVDGFNRRGHRTLGSGAVGWFDPATETARQLIGDFSDFHYAGSTWGLRHQLAWVAERLAEKAGPVFLFLNVGETHVPYYFEGAPWSPEDNPCVPFSEDNDRGACQERQRLALEHVDGLLGPLLDAFRSATTIVCADHGDCWGEDGLWEHGISHEKVLEVPLLYRLADRKGALR